METKQIQAYTKAYANYMQAEAGSEDEDLCMKEVLRLQREWAITADVQYATRLAYQLGREYGFERGAAALAKAQRIVFP